MSAYSASVRNHIIDPVFDRKNFKSEYRLHSGSAFLSNMRLINMGIREDADAPSDLNPLTGAFCIESIQLLDGNQLLDQVLEASIHQAFKHYNKKNDENISVENHLTKNNLGFVTSGNTTFDAQNPQRPEQDSLKIDTENGPNEVGASKEDTVWLNLKGLLPFLASSLVVPTDVFKNLKLVINWKSPSQLKNLVKVQAGNYSTLTESALVVDEMLSGPARDAIMMNYEGVAYRAVEADKVTVPAITAIPADSEKSQNNRFLVNGFNGKSVERMVIVQTPKDSATFVDAGNLKAAGNQCSVAQHKSSVQIRVNGANKIPRTGLTKKNQRLAMLTDSWGECNLIPGSNAVFYKALEEKNVSDTKEAQNMMGQFDYVGLEVREPVRELVVEYNRVGVFGNVDITQQLDLNIFCEVNKAVSVDKKTKQYVVSYL